MSDDQSTSPSIDSLWDFSDPAASEAKFRELAVSSDAERDPAYHAEIMTQVARAQGLQRDFDGAHTTLDAIEAELSDDTPLLRVRYLLERGRVFNSSGRSEQAVPPFLGAWECAVANRLDYYAVDTAHMLAIAAPPEAQLEWAFRGIEFAEQSADARARGWLGPLYNNLGWTLHDAERYDEALEVFSKALAWREEQGSEPEIHIAKWAIARTLRSLGRYDEALYIQHKLRARLEETGQEDGYVDEELGECLLALGRLDDARPHFANAYRLLSQDPWLKESEPKRIQRLQELGTAR